MLFRSELSILRGNYPLPVKQDVVMASDGAGEVIAVGDGVTRAKVGDRVAVAMFPRWIDGPFAWENALQIGGSLDGMLTEFIALNEDAVTTKVLTLSEKSSSARSDASANHRPAASSRIT